MGFGVWVSGVQGNRRTQPLPTHTSLRPLIPWLRTVDVPFLRVPRPRLLPLLPRLVFEAEVGWDDGKQSSFETLALRRVDRVLRRHRGTRVFLCNTNRSHPSQGGPTFLPKDCGQASVGPPYFATASLLPDSHASRPTSHVHTPAFDCWGGSRET